MNQTQSAYLSRALKAHMRALKLKKDVTAAGNFKAGFNAGWNARKERVRGRMMGKLTIVKTPEEYLNLRKKLKHGDMLVLEL